MILALFVVLGVFKTYKRKKMFRRAGCLLVSSSRLLVLPLVPSCMNRVAFSASSTSTTQCNKRWSSTGAGEGGKSNGGKPPSDDDDDLFDEDDIWFLDEFFGESGEDMLDFIPEAERDILRNGPKW